MELMPYLSSTVVREDWKFDSDLVPKCHCLVGQVYSFLLTQFLMQLDYQLIYFVNFLRRRSERLDVIAKPGLGGHDVDQHL